MTIPRECSAETVTFSVRRFRTHLSEAPYIIIYNVYVVLYKNKEFLVAFIIVTYV